MDRQKIGFFQQTWITLVVEISHICREQRNRRKVRYKIQSLHAIPKILILKRKGNGAIEKDLRSLSHQL